MARLEDPEISALAGKFVCVRVVQAWALDLSLFQFDYDLTWAVLFLNADRTIYGRYGSRSERKDPMKLISLEGFKKAMQGALEIHAGYPANRKELAGKTGPKPDWPTPEAIPENQGKPNVRPADGTRAGCVHCHQAQDSALWSLRAARQPVPDRMVWFFPTPETVGLSLDPAERATVTGATGAAEKAGFRTGDRIVRLEGQPVISIADVQWVLHHAKDDASIEAEVDRAGKTVRLSLAPGAGWRRRYDFTWRPWTWSLRHRLLGTDAVEPASGGLRVRGPAPDWVKQKNPSGAQFQKGDVIVEVDGRTDFATESDLLAYLFQKKTPGTAAALTVLRGGKRIKIALKLP